MATLKTASKIGPHIRFNNKLWVNPSGLVDARPGNWTVLNLADRQGDPLRTKVEVTWKDGQTVTVPEGRYRRSYPYEDAGLFVPPVGMKDIKPAPNVKGLARQVAQTLKAEGFRVAEARGFASAVAANVNWSALASKIGGDMPETQADVSDVSTAIDDSVIDAGWFGIYLLSEFGDTALGKDILQMMLASMTEWRIAEQREKYRLASALRSSVVKLAHDNPQLRKHLLPLLENKVATYSPGPDPHILKAMRSMYDMGVQSARSGQGRRDDPNEHISSATQKIVYLLKRVEDIVDRSERVNVSPDKFFGQLSEELSKLSYNLGRSA